jgi:phosphoglycolate phosphatase
MKYKAVLFDLDGTLLDTLADLGESMNAVLKRFGFPEHQLESYKYHVGDGVCELCRRVLPPDRLDETTLKAVAQAMRAEYGSRWDRKTRPYDGVSELLNGLTVHGIKMAILSNKPHDFTRLCVQKLLGQWHFDVVQGLDESIQKKPHPLGAQTVAKKLGFLPANFIYLGDTNTDMKTAVAAGMYPAGALWGFRTADELTANGAKLLIAKPTDLLKLI